MPFQISRHSFPYYIRSPTKVRMINRRTFEMWHTQLTCTVRSSADRFFSRAAIVPLENGARFSPTPSFLPRFIISHDRPSRVSRLDGFTRDFRALISTYRHDLYAHKLWIREIFESDRILWINCPSWRQRIESHGILTDHSLGPSCFLGI